MLLPATYYFSQTGKKTSPQLHCFSFSNDLSLLTASGKFSISTVP